MDKSILHFMDSYLLKINNEYFFATTQLELPFRLENQPLEVIFSKFNLSSFSLENISSIKAPKGIHIRKIYDLKFENSHFLFFVDHGLDLFPFPGGSVQRLDLNTNQIKVFEMFDKKFNFGGSAYVWRKNLYEVFVGIHYLPVLFINDVPSEEFNLILSQTRKDMGFLTSTTFEKNEKIVFFLGLTDIEEKSSTESPRRDYVFSFDGASWLLDSVDRGVPNSWATVFSEIAIYQGRKVLIVSHHDNGFNNFEIGFYEIDNGFRYASIVSSKQLGLSSVWVPGFLSYKLDGKYFWYVWTRPGSAWNGEKCCCLIIDESGNVTQMSQELSGVFQVENFLIGLTFKMELVHICG